MEDIIEKASQLSVGLEEVEVEEVEANHEDAVEDWGGCSAEGLVLAANSVVGRVFAKKHCSRKFLQMIFGRKWSFAPKWSVNILRKDEGSTYVGFTFETVGEAKRVSKEEIWYYNGGFMIVEDWPRTGSWENAQLK